MKTAKTSANAETQDVLTPVDMRESKLYKEAEALFRKTLRPGCGRPSGAAELEVSPDGKQVAFTGGMLEKLEGVGAPRICTTDLKTGELRVVSFGPNSDVSPKYSPDGKQLAFRSDRVTPGDFQVYFIDLESGETRAAPIAPGWVESLQYSPDGNKILLGVAGHGADLAGAQGAKTSKKSGSAQPADWMPAVETGAEEYKRRSAWILDVKSGVLRRASPIALNVWEVSWCGDDAIAAVASTGTGEGDWYTAHLVKIPLASGKAQVLYRPKDQLEWLSASPDGKQLAFVEAVCSDRWIVAGNLRIVDLKTGKVREVPTKAIDVTFTRWRSNSRLLVAGIRNFESVVADIDVGSGKVFERWASESLYCGSTIYPNAAVVPGRDNGFVITAIGHVQPMQVLHVAGSKTKTILDFGHAGTDEVVRKLRPVKPYRWKAPDGTEIHGWLMRGAGKRPAPLIMEVHGGPTWRVAPSFLGRSAHHVMLAERGYAIFWPNPRGSTGRGQDFARAVVGDMGGADTQDYLSGLDQLVADGVADPKRIGVTGGSYGGYMSSWLITQDQRFAAAVPISPVTNWVSEHLTSNLGHWVGAFLESNYTEAGSLYHTRSPVMHAHKARTPTLNICGALDRCTPPGQAREFHSALLESGVTSALVTYPQEGHGVRTFPGVIDFSARMVDWFTRYL